MEQSQDQIKILKEIEKKWQTKWEENKIFEPEVDKNRKKFYITVAFPYMNGKPHLGHLFTYCKTEFYSRFKRLQGFNVLFPLGFHCTGSPMVANALLVKEKNPKIFKMLKTLGVPEEEWEKFEDPVYWIEYFKPFWKETFKKAGFSIDWRREFITTYLNPYFSKFIEWQYSKLKEKGLIYKGKHPVVWCPKEKKIIGDHDRKDQYIGIQPEEVVLIKFKGFFKNKEVIFPTTTYRPETVYGVENLWINDNCEYYLVKKDNEYWIISNLDLKEQLKFEILEKIDGKELVNLEVENPITKEKIKIYVGKFVKPDFGTGVVMSVPSHAPFDYVALLDLGIKPKMKFLIETEGKKNLVEEIVKKLNIKSQEDKELLEKATKEVYKKEFHKGIFLIGEFKGKSVKEVKELITEKLLKEGKGEKIYILPQEVICRCDTKCIVNIVENQWFVKYSDKEWKEKAHYLIEKMRFWPSEVKDAFHKSIDWLKDWAISHDAKKELGTYLPWDKTQVIESLSDSTIYMAYYIIAKYLEENSKHSLKIDPEKLTSEFFDYIFLGKGDSKEISEKTGIEEEVLNKIKEEFDYWYPLDVRFSAKDLIQNHLSFFIFHHIAIFNENKWPKGIAVNGHVLLNGKKMSKSEGNIITTEWALNNWGADISRFLVAFAGDSTLDDGNINTEIVEKLKNEFLTILNELPQMYFEKNQKNNELISEYFVNYFNYKMSLLIEKLDELNFRTVIAEGFFKLYKELKNYLPYLEEKTKKIILEEWVKLISIFVPHLSEEIWEKFGKNTFISNEKFREFVYDENKKLVIDYIQHLIEKINEIKMLLEKKGNKIKKVEIFLPTRENYELVKYLKEKIKEKKNFNEIIEEIKREKPQYIKKIKDIQKLLKNTTYLGIENEKEIIETFKEIISNKLGIEIEIKGENNLSYPGNLRFNLIY